MRRPPVPAAPLAAFLLVTAAPAVAEPATAALPYQPPVPGRVLLGFQPPAASWASGHRGVDLAAGEGEVVTAAAAGQVTFAGNVARQGWVTLAHPDGIRTSYGPLSEVSVAAGDRVRAGEPLGTLASGHHPLQAALHWSARRGADYLDPLGLLGRFRPALIGPGREEVTDLPRVPAYRPWHGRRRGLPGTLGILEGSPRALGPGWPLPPNPNHVIGVAGLGSDASAWPLDLTHLGYAPEHVTYLSYSGRARTSGRRDDPRRDQLAYGPRATFVGVRQAALKLRDQLRAQQARNPGQAVDLVGHSMGGVVVLYYLLALHDPADPTLPPIAHAVTLAAPLEGMDLILAADSAVSPLYRPVLHPLAHRVGLPHLDDQAVKDLKPGSPLLAELHRQWAAARADRWSSPLATGTQVLTLGGSRDLIVPEYRSDLPGAAHVMLPGGHDRVRATEASRIALQAFLADEPVPGQAGGLGHWASYAVGLGEVVGGEVIGHYADPMRLLSKYANAKIPRW